ncbi:PAS domain-containing protein [Caulobacter sp. ErkDOM-YI]|uniref:PAS domain-containing protein n=1 Tax=unclassified Caulobacter TaxID=2648921 RepID=UPI003AF57F78
MAELQPRAGPTLTRIAGGEMAERVRAFDWSTTPIGAMEAWSPSLRLVVDMILATNFPMAVRWGPQLCLIYNDAYAPALHKRHPAALGMLFSEHSEAFQASLRTIHDTILDGTSGGYALEKTPLSVKRDGDAVPRIGHFTISYSPVPDASAPSGVGGVLITAVELTEAVETERTLRETERRYRLAIEAAGGIGAWDWDIKANKVYADAGYATLHSLAPELVEAGLPVESFAPALHPDDRERIRTQSLAAIATGGDFSDEYRLVTPDGSTRWVYARGSAYLDADGNPSRNTGVVLDITERKAAEADLMAARADLDLAVQAARMGRWDHNPSIGARFWDKRAREIFGLGDEDKNTTESFEKLIHPDDLPGMHATLKATLDPAGDGKINLEYRIHRASDGALRWIETFGRAYFEHGHCTRFVGVVSDVTERKETEAHLLLQEETLRLAVDAADLGIWELDVVSGLLTWSDRCYAMFGVAPGEPVTVKTFYERLHPDDQAPTRAAIARAVDPDIRADYALEFRTIGHDDGHERWITAKGQAFFSPEGKATRLLGATVDITDRKRAELHLRLLVNELNHRVKNSLATIQAIAAQSFNASRPLAEAQEAFTSRILALAEAHDLLTRENWEGAELHDIAARLAVLHGGSARFELVGPALRLSPRTALSLSMALHELATNAVKYGALSVPDGHVRLSWALAPGMAERLDLTWTEIDGPPVSPPTRRGFGSRLIERGLAAELSGEASIRFEPAGVVCHIRALLDA